MVRGFVEVDHVDESLRSAKACAHWGDTQPEIQYQDVSNYGATRISAAGASLENANAAARAVPESRRNHDPIPIGANGATDDSATTLSLPPNQRLRNADPWKRPASAVVETSGRSRPTQTTRCDHQRLICDDGFIWIALNTASRSRSGLPC